jgi:UDP-galactopyranose mutase
MNKDLIVIVGAGISGITLAERYANELNKKVLIFEKRNHIGGNCYDFVNEQGILISKYGAHLFHTNDEGVWNYVNKFSRWFPYEHKVLSFVDGKYVPVPVNITTVNKLLNLNINTEEGMKDWLKNNITKTKNPKNSEESAISRVGKVLYEKMFKNYTKKQWDMWPSELDASVMDRIPVHDNFDDRYFNDIHQALPEGGYSQLFEKMLKNKNIKVMLNTDYFNFKDKYPKFAKVFFTGPIDKYFNFKFGKLEYRSLIFKFKTYDKEFFQQNSVVNYPNNKKFTRIVEYKYFTRQKNLRTTVSREYGTWKGEPFYPVPSMKNIMLFEKYRKETERLEKEGIYFVGRLANYKYFNMDKAFRNALDLFGKIEK